MDRTDALKKQWIEGQRICLPGLIEKLRLD